MLQFLKKYGQSIIIAILVIVMIGMTRQCQRNKEEIKDLQGYNENFKLEKTNNEKTIALQSENILSNEEQIEALRDTINQFGEITQQIKVEFQIVIKEVPITIKDYVYIEQNNSKYLKTPAEFSYKDIDNWFSLKGVITDKGTIEMNEMTYRNDISVYAGWKKRTFGEKLLLKKKERQIGVVDLNPYSNVTKLRNFTIEEKKSSRLGLGISSGLGISRFGLTPYIGIGINYNIIAF